MSNTPTKRLVYILKTGRLSYKKSLELQNLLINQREKLNEKLFKNFLIITEHNPVYTIGIRTKNYTINDELKLKSYGAEFYKTNRGGLITFHGPGQMIAYPILNLKNFNQGVRWYVCKIEQMIIDLCKFYGIIAKRTEDTGIWIENRKICAIGIHVSRYVTSHGLALNCNTNLNWFDHIVPCGLEGKEVTSLSKELTKTITVDDVHPEFIKIFQNHFDCMTQPIEYKDLQKLIN